MTHQVHGILTFLSYQGWEEVYLVALVGDGVLKVAVFSITVVRFDAHTPMDYSHRICSFQAELQCESGPLQTPDFLADLQLELAFVGESIQPLDNMVCLFALMCCESVRV